MGQANIVRLFRETFSIQFRKQTSNIAYINI